MTKLGLILTFSILICLPGLAQDKKFDKSLKKIDDYIVNGQLMKAASSLKKLKPSVISKLGASNTYMPGLYLREARINLALGELVNFDQTLSTALSEAVKTFGENSDTYAQTLLEIATLYNEYGNFRIAREYTQKARESLGKTKELEVGQKARIALIEAEAMIGQGFFNEAISLLNEYQDYFFKRAVEKETTVEAGVIKSKRIPEEEIYQRFNDYVNHQALLGYAYGQKGRISVVGSNEENPDIDRIYNQLETWLRGKRHLLGPTSLAEVRYKYFWTNALVRNGKVGSKQGKELTFGENLDDLKKITKPTNALAHDIYLSYLSELLAKESGKYYQIRREYENLVENTKNYPKTTLHLINLKTTEFNSKLARDKTKNIESEALVLLNSPSLPQHYKTTNFVLEFLYDISISEKKYANAENHLNKLVESKKDLCGENAPEYHLAKLELANFYLDYTNKISDAGKIYQESFYSIAEPELGEQHVALIPTLNHIAQWHELTDRYAQASKVLKILEEAIRKKYDDRDILYAKELGEVSKLQLKLGEYDKAEANIVQARKIIDDKDNRIFLEWRTVNISLLDAQAKLYAIKGMFDEAEENLDEAKELVKKSKVPLTAEETGVNDLPPLMIMVGRFKEADELLLAQIPEYEKLYGAQSIRLIEPLVNKGRIALAKGDYAEAERLAARANKIAIQTYGENSTKTAPTQKLLSDIYYTLGDYPRALEQVTRALNSQEKQFGRKHIEVAKSISQLALIKFYKGDNRKEVEKLMLESRSIMEEKLGKTNPQYAEILKNVAVVYISEKHFDIAFNSLTIAESIWASKSGKKNNINLASIYTLTGDVYYQIKNYPRAEEFYIKAKTLYEKFFSANHPEYVKVLSKMSKVYYMQKDYKRAKKLIEESLTNYEAFIQQLFPALSEGQKAKYWNTIKVDFEFYNTLAFSNIDDFKDLSGKVYNYQLLTKALLLNSSIKMRERILNSTDADLKNEFNEWIQKKEILTLALSMSPAQLNENGIDPVQLQQDVERLEKDLSRRSELFGQSIESKKLTYEDVQKALKPNEVAIEMVRYRYFDHVLTDSIVYAAIYVKQEMPRPKTIIIANGKKMESRFFKYYRNCITGKVQDQYSYDTFWKPIHDGIGTASTIYLSADGVYNQINLEAIPTPDGKYIIDNSNIVLVSNTKDLYFLKVKSRPSNTENTASIFANPTFYASASSDNQIPQLPGTEKEGNQVQFMLKEKGYLTAQFLEANATEENIKSLNSPRILHFATHGFYRNAEAVTDEDEMQDNIAIMNNNPLLRTGLLLKGAGDLMDKTKYNYNIETGILTAAEAMNLSLDKTDLVVLSACETGLGELEAGEGVFGLQRSFLVAGAKVLIMSMFKVDDAATQELMLKFYQKWLNTGKMRSSFMEAKKELRTEYPEPIYWGAFMMIGLE